MQVPIRKPGKYTHLKPDAHMTGAKYNELAQELERMKKAVRPRLAAEVRRTGAFGDFSENAEYQIAKGKLRGLNQRILDTEDLLKRATIIEFSSGDGTIRIGSRVTVELNGKEKAYQILGSSETDPTRGIISHQSPIGAALIGRRAEESVTVAVNGRSAVYKIIKVE